VAEIRRPPVLAVGHQRSEVFLQSLEVELLEFFRIVERFAHRIGQGRVLPENCEIQPVRPPVAARSHSEVRRPVHDRALARLFVSPCVHVSLHRVPVFFELFLRNHLDFWEPLPTRSQLPSSV